MSYVNPRTFVWFPIAGSCTPSIVETATCPWVHPCGDYAPPSTHEALTATADSSGHLSALWDGLVDCVCGGCSVWGVAVEEAVGG
jgi:hypothetical protein